MSTLQLSHNARARAPQTPLPLRRRDRHALEAPRSERASRLRRGRRRRRRGGTTTAAASPASPSPSCAAAVQSCSLPGKGKTIPPLSLSLSRHSSIRRRSEICIWEKVLLLHTNARALTRHRACICLSRIYGDSCLCGRREREGRKEEESANSIRGGIQKMPREDLGAAEPAPTVSASRAAACDSSPTP